MRVPFFHPGPPDGGDHAALPGGPCASARLLLGGVLWFCLCLGLCLWLVSREGGAVLVDGDGQPVLATGDWLRHRDRLDDLMRQTLPRVMPGCRLLTMPGFSEQEARHYRVEGDGAPLRLALALQERLCQEVLRTGPDGGRLLADDVPLPRLRWTDDGVLEAVVDGRTCLVLHFPGWEAMLATLSRPMPEPALVLVMDDMGQKLEPAEQLASLPFPVALALWPHAPARRPVQQVARDMGMDVLLHMPMEAMPRKNGSAPDPGPGALETDMDAYAMEHALDRALAQVPTALGFNNHMGSGFTGRRDACRMLAGLAYGRGLFVLDSVTRGNSQLETSMVRQGIVTASRHVFLDDPQGTDKVLAALDKAARLARRQGIAIAIGHPHDSTLRALERWENREGVAVVPLRRYVWHLAQLRAGQAGRPE